VQRTKLKIGLPICVKYVRFTCATQHHAIVLRISYVGALQSNEDEHCAYTRVLQKVSALLYFPGKR